ncbi:hypothetical protein EV401DRAFT_1892758 [Pisolithus croceorrhizus]|nr:hypothetical protein EV401DRAFT_1892758 [Pisolithus croceorrhizus]
MWWVRRSGLSSFLFPVGHLRVPETVAKYTVITHLVHRDIVARLSVDVDEVIGFHLDETKQSVDVRTVPSIVTLPLRTCNSDCKTATVYEQFIIMAVQVTGGTIAIIQAYALASKFTSSQLPSRSVYLRTTGAPDVLLRASASVRGNLVTRAISDKGGSIYRKPRFANLARNSTPPSPSEMPLADHSKLQEANVVVLQIRAEARSSWLGRILP